MGPVGHRRGREGILLSASHSLAACAALHAACYPSAPGEGPWWPSVAYSEDGRKSGFFEHRQGRVLRRSFVGTNWIMVPGRTRTGTRLGLISAHHFLSSRWGSGPLRRRAVPRWSSGSSEGEAGPCRVTVRPPVPGRAPSKGRGPRPCSGDLAPMQWSRVAAMDGTPPRFRSSAQLGPHRPALVSCRAGVGPTRQLALGARLPYLLAGTPDGPGQAFSGWPSQFSQGPHGKAGPSEQARGHSPPCAPVRVRLAACPASLSHAQTPVGRLFGTLATSRKERTRMAVFHVKRAV